MLESAIQISMPRTEGAELLPSLSRKAANWKNGEMSHRAPYKTHSLSASNFWMTLTVYALSFGSATD
jgi:hypothetical protein